MTNFGASFKQARESKGISLDQIAKQTRISTRFLTAIENEDFHVLPGGIFNRGFVRTFAQTVGLDADQAVSDYERLVSVKEPADVLTSAETDTQKGERHLYPIAIGVLAIAIAIFYIVTRDSSRTAENPSPPVSATAPATPVPEPTAAPVESPRATPPPAPEATLPAAQEAPVKVATGLTLDVEARETTWVQVTADGTVVSSGELGPGMTRKFTAQNSIELSIGNAAGLNLKINDMPVKPLGKSGQVRFVRITPANFKEFIG